VGARAMRSGAPSVGTYIQLQRSRPAIGLTCARACLTDRRTSRRDAHGCEEEQVPQVVHAEQGGEIGHTQIEEFDSRGFENRLPRRLQGCYQARFRKGYSTQLREKWCGT